MPDANSPDRLAGTPVYDSARLGPAPLSELREIWRYRALLGQFVRRDIVTRYKRSVLGVLWTMLNPLGMMIILSVVFSRVFSVKPNFPAYLLSGLIVWNFLGQTTMTAMNTLLWGSTLLRRIYIPPTSFAVSATGTGLVNFAISLVPLFAVMLVLQHPLRVSLLFVPVAMLLLAMFVLGLALLVSSLAVFFYDVAELYQILLMAWFYLTPVFYPESILPAWLRRWIVWNPMYHLLRLFRLPVYDGRLPAWSEFWPALGSALASVTIGWVIFTWKSQQIPYRV